MGHRFLSDAWFEAVRELREAVDVPLPEAVRDLVVNVEVQDGPDGTVTAHMKDGRFEKGLAEGAPTTLKMTFEIARKLLLEGDQAAATQAFMAGQINVEGDLSKLMAMGAAGPPGEAQKALEAQIRAITE